MHQQLKKHNSMEVNLKETITDKKVKLVDGEFTPSEALAVLTALIDQKINYHKIENLQHWEKNHKTDAKPYINRIQELEIEKKNLLNYISEVTQKGKKLSISGIITIRPID